MVHRKMPSALARTVREVTLPGLKREFRNPLPEYAPRTTATDILGAEALERIKWLVPDFDQIKFRNEEAVYEALDYFYDSLYKKSPAELLAEFNYWRGRSRGDFPYSGEGTKAEFLKRMKRYHLFQQKGVSATLGADARHVFTACIALRAWKLPLPMARVPPLYPTDKDLRAPRERGVLLWPDWQVLSFLEKMARPVHFRQEDERFVEFNLNRLSRKPFSFRFETLRDRVHAERLCLSDWQILSRLITLIEVDGWQGWEIIFVADMAWRGYKSGPERFQMSGSERDWLYRIFERAAIRDEKHNPEHGKLFKNALRKFGFRAADVVLAGELLPAQKCLLRGGLSRHDSFVTEGDFQVVEDLRPKDMTANLSLLSPEILEAPQPEPVPLTLFELSPPPWNGEALQGELLWP